MPHVIEIKANSSTRLSLPTSSSEKSLNLKDEIGPRRTVQVVDPYQQQQLNETAIAAASQQQQQMSDDINVLDIVDGQLENLSLTNTERQKKLIEKWNRKTMCLIKEQKVVIDRSSWITTKNGKQIKYTSDTIGYPMFA